MWKPIRSNLIRNVQSKHRSDHKRINKNLLISIILPVLNGICYHLVSLRKMFLKVLLVIQIIYYYYYKESKKNRNSSNA